MPEYARVKDGTIKYFVFEPRMPPASGEAKGYRWLVVEEVEDPTIDPLRETLSDPVETVEAERVTRGRQAVAKPLETVKLEHGARAEQQFGLHFLAGFSPASGPLAGHSLQVRSIEDRTNWLTSQAAYTDQVARGNGDYPGATFRDAANVNVTVTFAEGLDALLEMAAWGAAAYRNVWALKDAIANAATVDDVLAVDVTGGW